MSENLNVPGIEEETEALTPTQIDTRHAHNLLERALNQVERGELEKGLLLCRQALHLAPHSFPVHSLLAMLLRRSGKLEEAVAHSEKALAILPDNEFERSRLAELRAAQASGAGAPGLHIGEWDQFKQEMVREIKLSNLLVATQLPPSSPVPLEGHEIDQSPLEFSPALPESPLHPALPVPVRAPLQSLWTFKTVLGAALLAGVVAFMIVRSVREAPRDEGSVAPPVSGETATVSPVGAVPPVTTSSSPVSPGVPPIGTPKVNPPAASGGPVSGSGPVPSVRPSTPLRPSVPNSPAPPSYSNAQAPAASRPPANSGSDQQPARPAATNQRPAATAPSRPQNNEPAPSATTPAAPASDDDVGPRFSAPKEDDDVGPRFSNP